MSFAIRAAQRQPREVMTTRLGKIGIGIAIRGILGLGVLGTPHRGLATGGLADGGGKRMIGGLKRMTSTPTCRPQERCQR